MCDEKKYMINILKHLLVSIILIFVVSGCSETVFIAHATKELTAKVKVKAPKTKAIYKVGKPYEINGVWYYPKIQYDYIESGIASWYGSKFHKKKTANGEIFDMNGVSAAHRTLPLPSLVRVTNLNSGRAINVRVNDRGPFVNGRIIDLSRRAAQLLGFERAGTAPVRVEILASESKLLAENLQDKAPYRTTDEPKKPVSAPTISVTSKALPPPNGAKAIKPQSEKFKILPVPVKPIKRDRTIPQVQKIDGRVTYTPLSKKPEIFVQAGAFEKFQNAHKLRAVLKQLGPTKISQVNISARPFFRVRIGPLSDVEKADMILAKMLKAGYLDATTVVD